MDNSDRYALYLNLASIIALLVFKFCHDYFLANKSHANHQNVLSTLDTMGNALNQVVSNSRQSVQMPNELITELKNNIKSLVLKSADNNSVDEEAQAQQNNNKK